jgi:hypothetical protein
LHFSIHVLAYIVGATLFLVFASYLFRKRLAAVKKTSVLCPTAQLPAEVRLNSDTGIESCSRMPYPESCSQNCTSQLQFSPDNLSEFVEKHEGKKCASCGTNLTGEDWYKSRLTAHTRIPEGSPSPAARMTTKAQPVCFACYQAFGAE